MYHNLNRSLVWLGLITCACSVPVTATAATISVENVGGVTYLQPNKPDQVIQILVSGGENFNTADLDFQVGDGTEGPKIRGLALSHDDLIFKPSEFPFVIIDRPNDWKASGGVSSFTTHPADGTLATLTIDTTGLTSGQWALDVSGPGGTDADALSLDFDKVSSITINDTTLEIVPEPNTIVLLLSLAAIAAGLRRNRS